MRVALRVVLVVGLVPLVGVGLGVSPAGGVGSVGTPSAYRSVVEGDDPLAYWPLDEIDLQDGSTVFDATDGDRDGEAQNDIATVVGGPFGPDQRVADFSGWCSGVDLSEWAEDFELDVFTVEAWVNYGASSGNADVVSWYSSGWRLMRTGATPRFAGWPGGVDVGAVGDPENDVRWHHLVGQSTGSEFRLFVDGDLVSSVAASGSITYGPDDSFHIGRGNWQCGPWFGGLVSNVAVYDRVLSASEVEDHLRAVPLVDDPGSHLGSNPADVLAEDPVSVVTGNFTASAVDLEGPGGGLGVGRSYNSRDEEDFGWGPGWRLPYGQEVWVSSLGVAVVTLADGRTVRFEPDGSGGWSAPVGFEGELVDDGDGTLSVGFADGSVWAFDSAGRLEATSDWAGESVAVSRDGQGRVVGAVSSTGGSLSFTWTAGALSSVSSSDGRSVSYGVSGGRLVSVTDPGGGTRLFTYTGTGLWQSEHDAAGVLVFDNDYDAAGRVTRQDLPGGSWAGFVYYPIEGKTTVYTVPGWEALDYHYDGWGRVTQITDPQGHPVERVFDEAWRPTATTGRGGAEVTRGYDGSGNVSSLSTPGVGEATAVYDSLDRPTSVSDPVSGTTTYAYSGTERVPATITDAAGGVTSQSVTDGLVSASTDPDGVTTTYTYTPQRWLSSVSDELGNTTSYTYDGAGRVTSVTTPESRVTAYTYDTAGRVLTVTGPDGGVTTNTWDLAGRLLSVTDPTAAVTAYTYDSAGRLATETPPGRPASTFAYDAFGNVTQVIEPTGGGTTTYTYGTLGRLMSVKDAEGRTTSYLYDDEGRRTRVTAPGWAATDTTYDTAGRVTRVEDPLDRPTTYAYQPNGLLASVTAPDGGTTAYAYDGLGRQVSVTDPTGVETTTAYSAAGRTLSVTTPAGTTSYDYDDAGRATSVTAPGGGETETVLDGESRPLSVTSPGGLVTSYGYDPGGRLATVTDPAGVVTTRAWSLRGELLSEQVSGRGQVSYTYNADGTMAQVTDAVGSTTTFAYDALGRPTGRTDELGNTETWTYNLVGDVVSHRRPALGGTPLPATVYTYDGAGRPKTVTDPSGRVTTNTFDVAGQLTARKHSLGSSHLNYTFTYDPAGRPATATGPEGNLGWSYDLGGRVLSATAPGGAVTRYGYDLGGRRVHLRAPDGTGWDSTLDADGQVISVAPTELVADTFTGANSSGPDGVKWDTTTVAGATASVVGNEMRLSTANAAGSGATLGSTIDDVADVEVSMGYRIVGVAANQAADVAVAFRDDGIDRYQLRVTSGSATARLERVQSATVTDLGSLPVPAGANTPVRLRVRAAGDALAAKAWPAAEPEPSAWGLEVTDTAIATAGGVSVSFTRQGGGNVTYVDDTVIDTPDGALADAVAYTYDPDGRVVAESFPGAGERSWVYTDGRLVGFDQDLPGVTDGATLSYDTAGAVGSLTPTGGSATLYGYDQGGQLTSITPPGGPTATYTYDALGRRSVTGIGPASYTHVYDDASRLVSTTGPGGVDSYTWDPAGRLTGDTPAAGTPTTYGYDQAGRLNTITTGAATHSRGYRPDGALTRVTESGIGSRIDWDSADPSGVAQPTGWHTPTTGHVPLLRGPSGWALTKTAEKTTPLPLDAFGSLTHTPLAAADGYGPFGEPDTPTTATVTLGYRGELTTGGLTHLRARDLHPHLGSFTTTDPLDGVPGTPTIANPYHYTDNNPLNRTDPTGLRPDDGDLDLGVVEAQLFGLRGILACDAVLRDAPKGRAITRLTPTSGGRCSYSAIDCVDRSWDVTGLARFGCQHADALLGILQFAASSAAGVICGSAVSVTVVGAGAAAGACAGATARFTGALRNGASLTDALRSALDATGMARDAALGGLTAGALKAAIGAIKALKPGQTIHNLAQKLTRPAPSAARASAAAVEQARFAPGKWLTHFEKHGASNCWGGNCLGYANSVEYLRRAQSLTRGGPGVDTFVRKSGDTLFYRATTNEFGVLTKDNVLRTYFKPDDGLDYWFSQIGGG